MVGANQAKEARPHKLVPWRPVFFQLLWSVILYKLLDKYGQYIYNYLNIFLFIFALELWHRYIRFLKSSLVSYDVPEKL